MAITLDGTTGITTPLVAGDALATQAEAEAGTDNTKLMTPLRVEQSLVSSRYIAQVATNGVFNSNSGFSTITKVATGSYRLTHPSTGANLQYVSVYPRSATAARHCRITIESATSILFEWELVSSSAATDTAFSVEVQPIP